MRRIIFCDLLVNSYKNGSKVTSAINKLMMLWLNIEHFPPTVLMKYGQVMFLISIYCIWGVSSMEFPWLALFSVLPIVFTSTCRSERCVLPSISGQGRIISCVWKFFWCFLSCCWYFTRKFLILNIQRFYQQISSRSHQVVKWINLLEGSYQ